VKAPNTWGSARSKHVAALSKRAVAVAQNNCVAPVRSKCAVAVVQNSRVAPAQSTAAAARNNSGLALRRGVGQTRHHGHYKYARYMQSAVVKATYCHPMAPNTFAVTNLNCR
jgi:hypothetical protein